jgi:hypothetical protein
MLKKIRRQDGFRYYLYVSDTKLDMLFDQIGEQVRKKISVELKIDLKLASVTLGHAGSPDPARMAKLRLVEEFITRNHTVGTVEDSSGGWFRGAMDMQWGWLESFDTNDASPLVFFRGQEDSHVVMLAGSRRHVIGEPPGTTAYAGSALPHIVAAIKTHFPDDAAIAGLRSQDPAWTVPLRASEVLFKDAPQQKMSFLAVSLAEENINGHHLLLGTPVYVALAS